MEYKTYPMHEKMMMERHFLVKSEFNIAYPKNIRLKDSEALTDSDSIEVLNGDIITVKPFKYGVDSTVYCYLVCFYNNAGIRVDCGLETYMSLDFILINDKLFEDITESFKRELKINEILEIK